MILKRQIVSVVMCLPLLVSAFAALAQSDATPETDVGYSDALMRALEEVSLATLDFGEAVRINVDRSAFDQEVLIDNLDFDAAEITRFVAEEIAFEPYAGVLRGAQGTLLARAGNALDQSLLLATLLNDAGYEAVIRDGVLTSADAARLVSTLSQRPQPPAPWNTNAVASEQTKYAESLANLNKAYAESGRVPERTWDDVMAGIEQDRDEILTALDSAGIELGAKGADDAIVREAERYFWVDYREGPSQSWVPAHPAFGKNDSPDAEVKATYSGNIPPELSHRVRLELIVEQRFGNKRNVNAMMEAMEIPSANLAATAISIVLLPDPLIRKDPYANGAVPLDETRFLIPIVNNGLPKGGRVLALDGTLVPPEAISVSQAGIFQTVGERFQSAASALQGLDQAKEEQKDLVALESVRLRVTLIHPTEGERTIERFLYRAPGESILADDADKDTRRRALVAELARSHVLGFAAGKIAPAYVADVTMADLAQMAPTIRAWADPAIEECQSLDCIPKTDTSPTEPNSSAAISLALFDNQMPIETGSIVYRAAPNVIRVSQPVFPENSPVPGVFDIMNNTRRAFRMNNGRPVSAPDLVLYAGVAETHLERLQPGPSGANSTIERPIGTSRSMQLQVLSAESLPASLTQDSIATEAVLIDRARARGSVVLVVSRASADINTMLGWWEVDPATGRTLGMARHGGVNLMEYTDLFLVVSFYISAVGPSMVCSMVSRDDDVRGLARPARQTILSSLFCCSAAVFSSLGNDVMANQSQAIYDDQQFCLGERNGYRDSPPATTRRPSIPWVRPSSATQ